MKAVTIFGPRPLHAGNNLRISQGAPFRKVGGGSETPQQVVNSHPEMGPNIDGLFNDWAALMYPLVWEFRKNSGIKLYEASLRSIA